MSDDEKKRHALLAWANALSNTKLETFEEFSSATHLFGILGQAAPLFFTDAAIKMQSGDDSNWVIRKGNLTTLATDMNVFARTALSASNDFDVASLVDVTAVAKLVDASSVSSLEALTTLVELVLTCVVLCGNNEVIAVIKSLPKDEQGVLSTAAKKLMGIHGLKPAKKGVAPPAASNAALPSTLPSSTNNTTNNATASAPAEVSGSSSRTAMSNDGDAGRLQNEVNQLRSELKERINIAHEFEARLEIAEREGKETYDKYRTLLQEMERSSSQSSNEKQLKAQIAKQETSIKELTTTVGEVTQKMTLMKERSTTYEDTIEGLKRKLSEVEAQLKVKVEEKQDAITQLQVLQDKAELANQTRRDIDQELLSLRSENAQLGAKLAAQNDFAASQTVATADDSMQLHLEEENALLKRQLSGLQNEVAMLSQRLEAAAAESAAGSELDNTIDVSVVHNEDDTTRIAELEGAVEAARSGLSLEHEKAAKLAIQCESLQRELEDCRKDLEKSHSGLAVRDRTIMELEKAKVQISEHLQRAGSELEYLKECKSTAEQECDRLQVVISQSASTAAAEAQQSAGVLRDENEQLRKQNLEQLDMIKEGSAATRKEQAILVSTVVRFGHKNLLLQQRQLLANSNGPVQVASAQGGGSGGGGGASFLSSWNAWLSGETNQDLTDIPGSFLTKHRRALERGLLDSLLTANASSSMRR